MEKDLKYYLNLPYQEIIVPAKEGGFVGYIPELKGCITQAETKTEVLNMLEDAKTSWLTVAIEDNMDIPEPISEDEYSGKFNLRIPKSLHKGLALKAKKEGVSFNQYVTFLLANGLGFSFTN